jgi:hypothetical protein
MRTMPLAPGPSSESLQGENLNVFFEFTAIHAGISSDGREKPNRE